MTMRSLLLLAAVVPVAVGMAVSAHAASEQQRARVVLVTSACDRGNLICKPFTRAVRRTGVAGRIVSPDPREDAVATLSLLTRQRHELIVVDPFWTEALAEVAPRFPKQRFGIVDVPISYIPGRPRNVASYVFETNEASYLAGWLAARMEQRRPGKDVVAAVGGARILPVNDFIVGFRAGARAAVPNVAVLTGYSNDFADSTKCEAIARRQIARGAGVVFNVANQCGLGAMRAARRAGLWAVGVDSDQSHLGPHVLTSVVKRFDIVMLTLLRQVRAGQVRVGRTTYLGLAERGSTLGRISPKVPAALRAELDRVSRRIVSGRIRVPGPS